MIILDLFSGIGGFSLAAHWMGWETIAFVEKEPFCQAVLRKIFGKDIEIHDDIFKFSGKPLRGHVDIITGGFPCQPFSAAGKRQGVNDERYLFPETLRIIREVQPAWIILENVNGLISMANSSRDTKLESRLGSLDPEVDDYEAVYAREEEMLLNRICEEIEREGYAVQPVVVPASAIGAPHERKRVWIVANSNGNRRRTSRDASDSRREHGTRDAVVREHEEASGPRNAVEFERSIERDEQRSSSNADDSGSGSPGRGTQSERSENRLQWKHAQSQSNGHDISPSNTSIGRQGSFSENESTRESEYCESDLYASDASESRLQISGSTGLGQLQAETGEGLHDRSELDNCDDSHAFGDGLQGVRVQRDGERSVGLLDRQDRGWEIHWIEAAARFCRMDDGVPDRVHRLKSLGNSVAPEIPYQFFLAIDAVSSSEQ